MKAMFPNRKNPMCHRTWKGETESDSKLTASSCKAVDMNPEMVKGMRKKGMDITKSNDPTTSKYCPPLGSLVRAVCACANANVV